jgi:hypothetical protein
VLYSWGVRHALYPKIERGYGHIERQLSFCTGTAVWSHTGKPAVPIRWVLMRDPKGQFDPQAFLCGDLAAKPIHVLIGCRQRWQVEVTFEKVRVYLGVETQRQWSDLAVLCTTSALFGLFSLVTLFAHALHMQQPFSLPQTAWYRKFLPTFIDALAAVRRSL